MAASYNFRTGFNGFNREDVVHYIEFINTKHTTQINQLKTDLAAAQQENAALRAKPAQDPQVLEQLEALNDKCAQKELRIEELRKALEEATAQRDAAQQELAAAKAQLANQPQYRNNDELEAYRRAERVERQAKERSDAMYQRANSVLADATAKVDDTASQVAVIADQVTAQLQALQSAVSGSKAALKDAATTLYAIRPED
jgi:chromosome segregation ATPase